MSNEPLYLYRYERGGIWNEQADVYLVQYPVLRETPNGYWIEVRGSEKFVLQHSTYGKKRFAYTCKEKAWDNYLIRTNRWCAHLDTQLEMAKLYLKAERPTEVTSHTFF